MAEGVETSTTAPTTGAGASTGTGSAGASGASTPAAATAAAGASGAAAQAQAWSLDTWKDEDWDSLPERIRTAADKRAEGIYSPKLTEAQTALQQHQADLAAAKRDLQDARAAHLKGDPYGARQVEEAKAALQKLQTDFDAYKGEWHPGRLDTYKGEVEAKWNAAREQANATYEKALQESVQREIQVFAPWYAAKIGDAANPQHDAARAQITDGLYNDLGAALDVPLSWFLQASGLNPAQRNGLVLAVLGGADPMTALRDASKPPAYQASPAARVAPGAPRPAPRPDESFRAPKRDVTRSEFRQAARAAAGSGSLNPDR